MSVSLASHSSNAFYPIASPNPFNVTKSSGVAVGDLMVIVAQIGFYYATGTPVAPTGWTTVFSENYGSGGTRIYAKIANAADVAATYFSIGGTGAYHDLEIGAVFLRIPGGAVAAIQAESWLASATASPSGTLDLTPVTPNALMVAIVGASQYTVGSSVSNYAIANNNPSWTELYDFTNGALSPGSSYDYSVLAVATASRAEQTATGTLSFTPASFHALTYTRGILLAVLENSPASGTAVLYEESTSFYAPVSKVAAHATTELLEATPEIFVPASTFGDPIWTPDEKPTTIWTPDSR